MEEIEFILESTEESMNGSIAHLEKEFLNIRAGKAIKKSQQFAKAKLSRFFYFFEIKKR